MTSKQTKFQLLPLGEDYLASLSVDCVIFGYEAGQLHVLVPQLNANAPIYTLPGGFVGKTEGVDTAARRVLEQRTGVKDIYLEQFQVFGSANRSRNTIMANLVEEKMIEFGLNERDFAWMAQRFISIGYYALVDMTKTAPRESPIDKEIHWMALLELPEMILDHNDIVTGALDALRINLDRKLIGFNLLPEEFTMRELQELYEAVYNQKYIRANFQKRMLRLDVLERLGKKFTGASNKAPYLYRFKR